MVSGRALNLSGSNSGTVGVVLAVAGLKTEVWAVENSDCPKDFLRECVLPPEARPSNPPRRLKSHLTRVPSGSTLPGCAQLHPAPFDGGGNKVTKAGK